MDRLTPSLGRLLSLALLISVPGWAVLFALVVLGQLSVGAAVPASAALWLLGAALLRPALRELMSISRFVRLLANGSHPPHPGPMRVEASQALLDSVISLDRAHGRREEDLSLQLQSERQVLESLPDPLLMLGQDAVVTRANEAARILFGREPAGRELTSLLRDPAVLEAIEAVLDSARSRQGIWLMPGPVQREFEVRATRLPARAVDGSEVLISLHDITALRRLEQMRADFVANASHELRTPLASLIGFTETLSTSAKDDEDARERFLAIMLEQAQRMQRLIEDLLSLSRIEMEEHTPPNESVCLLDVIRSVANLLELRARDKGVWIEVAVPEDPPDAIGDADQLSQILQNLMDNAIKYGPSGTSVQVALEVVDRGPPVMPAVLRSPCLRISVRDHGEGIPKEHIPRLTERFYRVDKARSRALGGTGLGLAIVKHVVARHRGAMAVESQAGQGTTFHVFLPIYRERSRRLLPDSSPTDSAA